MTLQEKLDAMNTKHSTLFVYSGRYHDHNYHASLDYEQEREKFHLQSEDYDNIIEAVDELYTMFLQVTGGSAFREAVPPLLTHTPEEADELEPQEPPAAMRDNDEVPL